MPSESNGDSLAATNSNEDEDSVVRLRKLDERENTPRTIGRFTLRGKTDDLPQDWWFASTAIPLLAATIGPLANVLSIAALVSKWRVRLPNNGQLPEGIDDAGINIPDPHVSKYLVIVLNAVSLGLGFFGNFFLLLNFTRRIRYIVALPVTIISWYFATGILTGIIIAMNRYVPPIRPGETYSQGFWHGIIASTLYMIGSIILMINMLGYFLGHYPQHFDLDDDQRTLILQTMMFFFWLAGGAAVFARVCGLTYANALYFCDVTVLTVGFGDVVAANDAGRGIVFPYSVIGIIFLGLMINSIRKFAAGMSKDKVIRKHQLNIRERTFGRTVTSEKELRDRLGLPPRKDSDIRRPPNSKKHSSSSLHPRTSLEQYGRFVVQGSTIMFQEQRTPIVHGGGRGGAGRKHTHSKALSRDAKMQQRASGKGKHVQRSQRRERLILLKEDRDRFNAMRDIQAHTSRFKQYYALSMSVLAFSLLWCVGAAVFMVAERRLQGLTYFQSLYFCYVSLLTIGYGDFSPQSNAGKPFFVIWSLVAVPTMTILVSDMGDTVVGTINRGTFTLADWTVMPRAGVWHDFLEKHTKIRDWLARKTKEREAKKRIEKGFALQNPAEDVEAKETISGAGDVDKEEVELENLEEEKELTEHDLARKLALAIKRTANDLRAGSPKKYTYEEWMEFAAVIKFTGPKKKSSETVEEDEEEDILGWDWIGEDSPMLAEVSESEWVLDRLCESLNRYTRIQARRAVQSKEEEMLNSLSRPQHSPTEGSSHTYPAHPGPRHGHHDVSPVLSKGPSGVEVMRLKRHLQTGRTDDEIDGSESSSSGLEVKRRGK